MKTTIIILLLFLTNCLVGQNYSITEIESPNSEKKIRGVYLFDTKAFAGGSDYSLYYNGEELIEIFQPNNYTLGCIGGIERPNGEIYAFQDNFYRFYKWNNTTTNWQVISRPENKAFKKIFVLSENNVYLCGNDSDNTYYGSIYFFDGSEFTELDYRYGYSYKGLYVKDNNNIILLTKILASNRFALMRFDGENFQILYTFPEDRGSGYTMYTNDGNTFFFLSICGDVYSWEEQTEVMEQIHAYPEEEKNYFSICLFATDNNNLFLCGKGGIRHMNVSTGSFDLVYDEPNLTRYISSAGFRNGRAMFVTSIGQLFKITITNSIDPETVEQLAIYPNPATDNLTIEFPVFGIDDKTIEILDLNGKIVATTNFSSFKVNMDISGLSNGVYFLRLSCEEGLITKKFIK